MVFHFVTTFSARLLCFLDVEPLLTHDPSRTLLLSAILFYVGARIAPSISKEAYLPKKKWYFRGKKAASRSDLPLSTHVVLKTTYVNPKDYARRY